MTTPQMHKPANHSLGIFSCFPWQTGDIVISSGPKQGTTWMLNIVHQLRTGGDTAFLDINDECPFLERLDYPDQSDQERLAQWQRTVFQRHVRRVFKTHVAPPVLPFQPNVKYIVPVRNGKDTIVSHYFFAKSFTDEFRALWGGRPQPFASLDACFDWYMAEQIYWSFLNDWLPYRHAENVLLLHYADLKRDLAGNLRRIAAFLDFPLSPEQLPIILEHCGFRWMKEHASKFEPHSTASNLKTVKAGGMIRTGAVGDYKMWFTPEQEARWEMVHRQQIPDDSLRRWCDQGTSQ